MRVIETELPGVLIVESAVHGDDRGHFFESWHAEKFAAAGINAAFVQDNQSRSARGVLRGLHYQVARPQGKLVRVTAGAVCDVAVDLRRASPTFKRWVAIELSAENKRQLWIPEGFGHGFLSLADGTDLLYKCTDIYLAEHDRAIRWNDPDLKIAWPIDGNTPSLSAKDRSAPLLKDAEIYA
jgi:dTDP-4-dehydrorhamnose 3,5-epimerase